MNRTSYNNLLSIISIAANTLTAGSIFTYPIFSSSLQTKLHFSIQQVSTTASIAILNQYLSAALWGSLADRLGSGRVSLCAGILFFLGYSSLSYLLLESPTDRISSNPFVLSQDSEPAANIWIWIYATFSYALCGAATVASYFAALTASTQIFGTSNPGLSVAGPSSLFGSSPILLSAIGVRWFSTHTNRGFNSSGYLSFLAMLSLVVNSVGSITLQRRDPSHSEPHSSIEPDERSSLIQTSTSPSDDPSLTSPGQQTSRLESEAQGTTSFLSSPTVWLFGMVVLLSAGPAEMTYASIGAIVDAKHPGLGTQFKAQQVQLISLSNTSFRVLSGWLSDRYCGSHWGARLALWGGACLAYSFVCFLVASGHGPVWVLSAVTGSCYGSIFTLAPSLVATVWPISSFGRNYGIISYFSAVGSFSFTFLFGILFDSKNPSSLSSIYTISGLVELAAISCMLVLFFKYWAHRIP